MFLAYFVMVFAHYMKNLAYLIILIKQKVRTNSVVWNKRTSLWSYRLRLETTNPLSKASLQTCDPTKPLPPSTSSYTNTDVRSSSVIFINYNFNKLRKQWLEAHLCFLQNTGELHFISLIRENKIQIRGNKDPYKSVTCTPLTNYLNDQSTYLGYESR